LTPEEIRKIATMHATAAISLQYTSTDWAQVQIRGVRDQLKKMGISAVPVTKENILAAWKQVHGVDAPDLCQKGLAIRRLCPTKEHALEKSTRILRRGKIGEELTADRIEHLTRRTHHVDVEQLTDIAA
jgi:hypothetical protein